MGLSAQQQNFLSELQQDAESVLAQRNTLREIIARWNLNDFSSIFATGDIKESPTFAHLDKEKVSNAITAFQQVLDALGDDVSGQATNLLKLKG